MSRQIGSDFYGVLKGLIMVSGECLKLQENHLKHLWSNSSINSSIVESGTFTNRVNLEKSLLNIEKFRKEILQRSSMVVIGVRIFASQWSELNQERDLFNSFYKTFQNRKKSFENNSTKNILKITPLHVENVNSCSEINEHRSRHVNIVENHRPMGRTSKAATSNKKLDIDGKEAELNKQENKTSVGNLNENIKAHHIKTSVDITQKLERKTEVNKDEGGKIVVKDDINKNKPFKYQQSLSESARPTKVPSSRLGRMISFGSLAAGLGIGTLAEVTRRTLGWQQGENLLLTPANAERIVATLCKVRGAALKIGQILSIQDNNVISPALQQVFERVRQSADFMPSYQVEKVMCGQLGADWRTKLTEFELKPFAAASIGQVHYGKTKCGTEVAIKIQYPGVAKGINSDIENLVSILNLWNVFPEGMFIDKIVEVAKKELAWEVDYIREAECTKKFKKLLSPYSDYFVPAVIDELSNSEVFTTELVEGLPVDKCIDIDEEARHHISTLIMNLCLEELFHFRYMQTDPNWSNFFYNQNTRKLILLDFGATRSYDKLFMDKYISVIKAAADGDRQKVLEISRDMKFLTGFESKEMEAAHVDTVMILGEVFSYRNAEFDFGRQDTTLRVSKLVPTILHNRLCPPPEEIYSLHRKLSGVFLLCAKLGVKIPCRDMFMKVYDKYVFN